VERLEETEGRFGASKRALQSLLRSEDPGSGYVTFMY
jgi:hypothetical protein